MNIAKFIWTIHYYIQIVVQIPNIQLNYALYKTNFKHQTTWKKKDNIVAYFLFNHITNVMHLLTLSITIIRQSS